MLIFVVMMEKLWQVKLMYFSASHGIGVGLLMLVFFLFIALHLEKTKYQLNVGMSLISKAF